MPNLHNDMDTFDDPIRKVAVRADAMDTGIDDADLQDILKGDDEDEADEEDLDVDDEEDEEVDDTDESLIDKNGFKKIH